MFSVFIDNTFTSYRLSTDEPWDDDDDDDDANAPTDDSNNDDVDDVDDTNADDVNANDDGNGGGEVLPPTPEPAKSMPPKPKRAVPRANHGLAPPKPSRESPRQIQKRQARIDASRKRRQ